MLLPVARVGLYRYRDTLAELDKCFGMADAGGGTEENGRVEVFRDFAGYPDKILALLAVGRLHHRDLRGAGVVAVVLLVLGRVHTGVVCRDDNEARVHPQIAGGENRVGGNIQTDVLHRAQRAASGDCRAVCHLGRHLFVGRPLAVHVILISGGVFKYLRAGRSGIGRADPYTGLIDTAGYRLVTGE